MKKHEILRAICKSPEDKIGEFLRVRTPRFAEDLLAEARKADPGSRWHLVCSTCHSYVPEDHRVSGEWQMRHTTYDGRPCHPHRVYRFLEPWKIEGIEPHSPLSPAELLADVARHWEGDLEADRTVVEVSLEE